MKKLLFKLAALVITAAPAFAYRDLETGVFLSRDPLGPAIQQPQDKYFLDGKEISQLEYVKATEPWRYQQVFPNDSTKSSKDDGEQSRIEANQEGEHILGKISHVHLAVPGEPNLYVYSTQNPWTKFDPEGLSTVRITDNKGKVKTLIDPSNKKLRQTLAKYGDHTIQKIEIVGHGGKDHALIGTAASEDAIVHDSYVNGGKVTYNDDNSSFADSIRNKMVTAGAMINLGGCNTARQWPPFFGSQDHITSQLSKELPGVQVTGSRGFTISDEVSNPFNREAGQWRPFGSGHELIRIPRTYLNGQSE